MSYNNTLVEHIIYPYPLSVVVLPESLVDGLCGVGGISRVGVRHRQQQTTTTTPTLAQHKADTHQRTGGFRIQSR